jgi:hypothetical protein
VSGYNANGGGLQEENESISGPSLPSTGLRFAPSEVSLSLGRQNLDHNSTDEQGASQECVRHVQLSRLRRSVGTRKTEVRAPSGQKGGEGLVDKLSAIVCLHVFDREAELCASISERANDVTCSFRLCTKGYV